jgi:hypothetical protein
MVKSMALFFEVQLETKIEVGSTVLTSYCNLKAIIEPFNSSNISFQNIKKKKNERKKEALVQGEKVKAKI